ncbi:MAG TPA: hypothetical protein VIN08_21410 [Ohtaekwangia sp.]|uniref:hypothetical protein n=1 Tax=Ohtaekwangia sp. TaxID=2066019 RepID=UPI002F947DB9
MNETYYLILCRKYALYISSDDEADELFEWLNDDMKHWEYLFQMCALHRPCKEKLFSEETGQALTVNR